MHHYIKLLKFFLIATVLNLMTFQMIFAETIKIGYFKLEPHTMVVDGKHTGALVDYWEKYLAPAMNVKVEWEGPIPPLRLMKKLETGDINVIALLAKNKERAKKFDYPETSFYRMTSAIAVAKDNPLNKINTIEDIIEMKMGFFKKGFKPPVMRDPRIKWEYVNATDWKILNLRKVLKKRLDAAFDAENNTLLYEINKYGFGDKMKVLLIPGTFAGAYSLFSKQDKGRFVNKYNKIHKKVMKKMKYEKLLTEYLNP